MEDKNLSQRVRELRKNKGLSQEELAETAGLSLRTIQRVENRETEPTGDTLKRIATALDSTPAELLNWTEETLKATVKTKNEYLHIFEDKLVISKGPKIKDKFEDYSKNVDNTFKSLTVSLISVPIFTAFTVYFYISKSPESAIYPGALAFFFFILAIRTLLFNSNSSLIKMESITEMKIKRRLYYRWLIISYKESGRVKERLLFLEKNQAENMKNSLLSEKLIEEKNIKLKSKIISYQTFIIALAIIVALYFTFIEKTKDGMPYFGVIMLFMSVVIIIEILYKLIAPSFNKTTKSVSDERV